MERAPKIFILAGPNGAGKSTASPYLLRDYLDITEFVNADDIARGLSGFAPEREAFAAGRIMLRRIRKLASARADFAFETTLATRSYAPWIRAQLQAGFRVGLIFLSLPSADIAVQRVQQRIREGGHSIPEAIIRRRYRRGLDNLFSLYMPIVSEWTIYDNAGASLETIAEGAPGEEPLVARPESWQNLRKESGHV